MTTPEERAVEADEAAMPETAEPEQGEEILEEEPAQQEFIEFVGQKPYGTEFYGEHGMHSISRGHFRKHHDIDTPKDLEWKRGHNGRFLVPVADMSPAAAEMLANDPMFKRVTL